MTYLYFTSQKMTKAIDVWEALFGGANLGSQGVHPQTLHQHATWILEVLLGYINIYIYITIHIGICRDL